MTITYEEVTSITRPQLEHEVRYLMKKREVLEQVIIEREQTIEELRRSVEMSNIRVDQMKLEFEKFKEINQDVLERLNNEKNQQLSEIDRLAKENKRLKKGVPEY